MGWIAADTTEAKKHTIGTSVLFVKTAADAAVFIAKIAALHYTNRVSKAKMKKVVAEALEAVAKKEIFTFPVTDSDLSYLRTAWVKQWIAEQMSAAAQG